MSKRIGDYIQLVNEKNVDLEVDNLLGVNIENQFMPSIANVAREKLVKYKLIRKNQFATNIMHVGRDQRIPIAHYTDDEPAIVSPAYKVFEVVDETVLYPEYLMIEFLRPEFDRKAWFYCDSSVRGGLDWDRFCDIEIPIPPIEQQKKYVDIYQGLINNQKAYETGLDELQFVCTSYMDTLKKHKSQVSLDEVIELVDQRNKDKKISNLLGMNVNKEFMPSKANVSSANLYKYKVIQKGQFAYSPMQVGRDKTVRVALYDKEEPAIISPAYSVFKVKYPKKVLPEFLVLWFFRPEFNRYGWFLSDSSVRSSLEWERFTEIKVPIPRIEEQGAIVTIYHTLQKRKRINQQLKGVMKPLCPVLMRGVVEEMEEKEGIIV